jgi:hypothetical protein
MFWRDHQPPHFHVEYSGHTAVMEIHTLAVIGGWLPARALGLTVEWASVRKEQLLKLWAKAQSSEPLEHLAPLE